MRTGCYHGLESPQTYSLPQCPCPQPATGPTPQSPLLPWANESQMAACDSAVACGNPDVLPSHAPHPALAAPAGHRDLLLRTGVLAGLALRVQVAWRQNGGWHSALDIPEGPSKLLCGAKVLTPGSWLCPLN